MSYLVFDSGYRGPCNKEDDDGISFYAWVTYHFPEVNIFHIVNEFKGTKAQGDRLNKKGRKKGVSDYIILTSGTHSHAAIELKRKDRAQSQWKTGQREFLIKVHEDGGYAAVAYGLEEAKKAFLQYYDKSVAL